MIDRGKNNNWKFLEIVPLTIFIVTVFLLGYSFQVQNFLLMIICAVTVFGTNILFSISKFKERMLFFWFQITIGVFLVMRPLIQLLEGEKIWGKEAISKADYCVAVLCIVLSMIGLYVGANIFELIKKIPKKIIRKTKDEKDKNEFKDYLQAVSMVLFYITLLFYIVEGLEKAVFVSQNSYLDFYSDFSSRLPWFFSTIGSFMKYSLCIFLATFPSKRRAFWVLFFFEGTAFIDLFVGIRGTIVLNSLFILIYYLIRDFFGDKEKWFGKVERAIVIGGTPFVLAFMTAYASIRSGLRVLNTNIFQLIKDFFVSQGVTFEVVARGISVQERLPNSGKYTFGSIIDYFVHGRIGQMLFGTEALPAGNNVINGTESNSLAHNLSYLTRGKDYLDGRGWGSSYVLENYIDFGYIGVIVFAVILGIILIAMMYCFGENILGTTVILVALQSIFYIPRAESTVWILFIFTMQFWLCTGCCYAGTYIVKQIPVFQMILRKLKLLPKEDVVRKKNKTREKIAFISVIAIIILICGVSVFKNIQNNKLKGEIVASVQTSGTEYEGRKVVLQVVMEEEGKYQYKFSETYKEKEKTVQEYSSNNTHVFIAEGVGVHTFYVDIKNEKGQKKTLEYILYVRELP